MHVPTHGQWWSNIETQLLQKEQWCVLGGLYIPQDLHNFVSQTLVQIYNRNKWGL